MREHFILVLDHAGHFGPVAKIGDYLPMPPALLEILHHGHEKISDKWSSYIPFYQKVLAPFQEDAIQLLEIGVQNGGSIEVWSKFFPKATCLVGCDIDPLCGDLEYDDPRVKIIVGDAGQPEIRDQIASVSPEFDIVIDDGSHRSEDVVRAFALYFPMLKPGGIYIAEDLHASYFADYEGGSEAPYSSWNFFKRLTDYVNREHWGADVEPDALVSFFADHWNIRFIPSALEDIAEFVFVNSVVVIRKGEPGENSLGPRVITGKLADVEKGVLDIEGAEKPSRNEARNPFGPLARRLEFYPGYAKGLEAKLVSFDETVERLGKANSELARARLMVDDLARSKSTAEAHLESLQAELDGLTGHLASARAQVDQIGQELKKARRKPLKALGKLVVYKFLRALSMARPLVSKRAAARFARSAEKRNPSRIPGRQPAAPLSMQQAATSGALPPLVGFADADVEMSRAVKDIADLKAAARIAEIIPAIEASGFWDEHWYRERHWPEIQAEAQRDERIISPLHHYLLKGWRNGYEPSARFPLKRRTDLGEDPLSNFLKTTQFDGYQFEENHWFPTAKGVADHWLESQKRSAKRVVYTCVAGNYDALMQPYHIDPASDYVCFTDNAGLIAQAQVGVWAIKPLQETLQSPAMTNRWHKMHPHRLFSEYEESVYVDGNVNILSNYLFDLISEKSAEILIPRHFKRTCVSQEIDVLVQSGKINLEQFRSSDDLIKSARSAGFPANWGLSENNVIFRKHNDPRIREMMTEWWDLTQRIAPRDQVHLSYLLWKNRFSFGRISFPNCRSLYKDFAVVRHNTPEEILLCDTVETTLSPAFEKANVPIVLSCNDAFVDFLDVLLTSIVENSSANRNYDIIILHRDVTKQSQERIARLHGKWENVSIRFHNMSEALAAFTNMELHLEGYVPVETYNKIFLNEFLTGYDKIVYIDTDIILNRDIADLYDIDLRGRAIGASANVANIHAAHAGKEVKNRDFNTYLQDTLGVKNVNRYFQAGVLIVDLSHRNTRKLFRKCVEKINEIREPAFFDQCIYNSIFYGDVHFFSVEWNTVWYLQNYSHVWGTVPEEVFFDYARSFNKPSLVHFASGDKPTNKTDWRLGEHFWKYAVRSDSCNTLLAALTDEQRESPQVAGMIEGRTLIPEMTRLLVHVHLFYEDQLPYIMASLANLGDLPRDVFFTLREGSSIDRKAVYAAEPGCKFIELPNLGYDLYPFLEVLRRSTLSRYDYILKIHTKAPRTEEQGSVYGIDVPGYAWRDALFEALIGSPGVIRGNLERMEADRTIGAIGCRDFIFSTYDNNEENTYNLAYWRSYLNVSAGSTYVGGTMFLARAFPFERFRRLQDLHGLFQGPEIKTKSHKDFAHVVERLCGIIIENEGLTIEGADPAQHGTS